jgi:hypothetical protein
MENQDLYARFIAWYRAGRSLFFSASAPSTEVIFNPEDDNEINTTTDPDLNDPDITKL